MFKKLVQFITAPKPSVRFEYISSQTYSRYDINELDTVIHVHTYRDNRDSSIHKYQDITTDSLAASIADYKKQLRLFNAMDKDGIVV